MKLAFIFIMFIPAMAMPQDLNWQLAVPKAIQINPASDAWHSGRVQDMIDFSDGSVLVGTNGGGIWWTNKQGSSRCLSNTWNDPDILSVERGPYSEFHVYVSTGSELKENISSTLDAWQTLTKPAGTQLVRDITILSGARRIIIGCDNGLFWSEIPLPNTARTYSWQRADGIGSGSHIRSVSSRSTGAVWQTPEQVTTDFLSNLEIASVSRSPMHRDVFWITRSGTVRSSWNILGSDWNGHTLNITSAGSANPNSRISAINRGENHLDVFFSGPDGELKTTWWDISDGNWQAHTYTLQGPGAVGNYGAIHAIARTPNDIDLFWVTLAGAIKHISWSGQTGSWTSPIVVTPSGGAATSTRLTSVSRNKAIIDLFWIAPNGEVRTNSWQQGGTQNWTNLVTIAPNGAASLGGGISAVARDDNKLDVVWISNDGRVMTSYWNSTSVEQWNGHAYALSSTNTASLNNNVALISRNPLHLDIVWRAPDGSIKTNWWNQYSATNFALQNYNLGNHNGNPIGNIFLTSAFDDEMSMYYTNTSGNIFVKRWRANDGIVIAGLLGTNANPIIKGTFNNGVLRLSGGMLRGGDGVYNSSSVSVSKYGTVAYATVANPSTSVLKYIFKSNDFGSTWNNTPTLVTDDPGCNSLSICSGDQGNDWNNTIAASPVNNDVAYVGWVKMFCTINGGSSWKFITSEHVHPDIAKINFGTYDRKGQTGYFCTDGGLSATFDQNRTYFSKFNENLATLQCYTTDGIRQTDGTLGVSYDANFLIGTGIQDNGNVWALHGSTPWKKIDGGDGGYFTFTRDRQAIRRNGLTTAFPLRRSEWNGSELQDRGVITVDRQKPGATPITTLDGGGFAIVNAPVTWDALGAKIYGYGFSGADVYSFWNPSGFKGWRWEYEATLTMNRDEYLSAGGSANGQVGFFGTSLGRIISFDRRSNSVRVNQVNTTAIPDVGDYGINRMCILSATEGYALLNGWRNNRDKGYILKFDGENWSPLVSTIRGVPLPVQRYFSIEADWTTSPISLLLTCDDKVYRSRNSGSSWVEEVRGLPRRAHLADSRFVVFPNGTKRFYVSTFGRSVWYADVP